MPFDEVELGEIALAGDAGLVDGPFGSNLPASDYVPHGVPVIRGSNLSKGEVRFKGEDFVFVSDATADRLNRSTCIPRDIIFTKKGTLGQVGIVPPRPYEKYLLSSNQMRLRVNEAIANADYVYYALSTYDSISKIIREAEHTGVPKINLAYIRRFRIPLPPRSVQDQICGIISALDNRIDVLRQTNATLESIAQVLFKSWFIDFDPVRAKAEGREPDGMDAATAALFPAEFEESALGLIPKGWRASTLDSICTNPRAQAKPGQMPADTTYIGLEHMPRKSIALGSAGTAAGLESGKFWFERNDVLFGKLRPYFHKVGLAPCRGVCSTDILVLRPKAAEWLGFLVMHASSDALISHATQLSNGARMPRTSWHDVGKFDVALPLQHVAMAFNAVVYPMFERIHANIDMARVLSDLRDTLLPRLISGNLRLPEAQAQLDEAIA
ncbi:restriction endonuclease subunit S [Massilia oculi]|uniref:restriction endonuclease subunit S n=1 Tax=Massilia oculi TaxID=945844 RepID=UPI0028A77D5D|nr:restriction endonuclease subunit S [Massilia oculi]